MRHLAATVWLQLNPIECRLHPLSSGRLNLRPVGFAVASLVGLRRLSYAWRVRRATKRRSLTGELQSRQPLQHRSAIWTSGLGYCLSVSDWAAGIDRLLEVHLDRWKRKQFPSMYNRTNNSFVSGIAIMKRLIGCLEILSLSLFIYQSIYLSRSRSHDEDHSATFNGWGKEMECFEKLWGWGSTSAKHRICDHDR